MAELYVRFFITSRKSIDIIATRVYYSRMVIDTIWFMDKIQSRHESLRKFSKMMVGRNGKPLDVAAISLMLRGKRSMQIDEARQIAKLLNVPLMTVIEKASGPIDC
jgi:hypothetical protein